MRIDKLTLKNFKCYENTAFDFNPRFNLIIGENGAGKSSLLDAIAVAAGSWFTGIRGYDSRNIAASDVRVVYEKVGDTLTKTCKTPVCIEATGEVTGQRLTWGRTHDGPGSKTNLKSAAAIKKRAESAELGVRDGKQDTLPLISYYGAGRLWVPAKDMIGDGKPGGPSSRLEGYLYSLDPRIHFAELFRWFAREKGIGLEKGERHAFKAAKLAMSNCIEGCTYLDYSFEENTLILEIKDKGRLPFPLLSDGQRAMLALVADIAMKADKLNPHLGDRVLSETPGIVLIDELDLHLHPKWQRHVVTDLKRTFPSIQFFASSHSPQILGEVKPEEIVFLGDDAGRHRGKSQGMDSNWILRYLMGAEPRSHEVMVKLDKIRALIGAGQLDEAQAHVDALRGALGEFDELVSLAARIDADRFDREHPDTTN